MINKPFIQSVSFVAPFAYPLLSRNGLGGSGGAERQFFLFGKELAERGWKVSFITDKPTENIGLHPTIFPVYHASFSYLGGSKTRLLPDWLTLWRAMAKANACYYVLKVPGHLLAPMSVFCKVHKRKLVFWAQMSHDANPLERKDLNKAAALLQNWGLKRSNIVIAQRNEQRKAFNENYGINAQVVPSICYSLITNTDVELKSDLNKKEVDILWVGNSMPKKRQEVFFELARLLPHCSFAIAMNNSDQIRFKQAREEADKLPNVIFLGTVPPSEMESWFQRTKLFLNTSIREGFPNTFLQSWMNGVPVVSLNVDPDKIISNYQLGRVVGENGTSIKLPHNHKEMAKKLMTYIEVILEDNNIYQKMCRNSYKYVIQYHAPDRVVPKLIEVLERGVSYSL